MTALASPTGSRTALDPAAVRSTTRAVYAVFALNGAAFATWAARIPDLKRGLDLGTAQLGMLLLSISIGSVLGLPVAGRLTARWGVQRAVVTGAVVVAAGVVLAGVGVTVLASAPVVAVSGFFMGLAMGLWDVAMNLEGAHVEHHLGRSVMPRFHAAFSGGTVVAALVGAGAAALHASVLLHFAVLQLLMLAGVLLAARGLRLPAAADAAGERGVDADTEAIAGHQSAPAIPAARSAWLEPRTWLIGVVVLVAAFTEGTANDWLSLAFVEGHRLPGWAGILAFAVFLAAMTTGRLLGTPLLDRFGRVLVLRVSLTVAVLGSLLVVFGGWGLAYVGAATWGAGVSLGFPVGMSAAADDPQRAPARMSVVATIGYTAFLAGPPLLGFLGAHVGVLRAMLVVGCAVLVALACLPAVREQQPVAPEPACLPAE